MVLNVQMGMFTGNTYIENIYMTDPIRSYRDLLVWQKSIDLCVTVYKITRIFPREEQFGLTSQMRRACISISSNIAEGRHRGSRKEFLRFLYIAYASGVELESQFALAERLFPSHIYVEPIDKLHEILRMLNGFIQKMQKTITSS